MTYDRNLRALPDVIAALECCQRGEHIGEELANRLEELTRPGRWIYYRDDQNRLWCKCSLCSKTYGCLDTPFCPNCGHPMIGEDLE